MRWLIFALPILAPDLAYAKGCEPPAFYRSLPRDREWYYGAGKGADAGKARDQAIRSLGKQVTGDVEGWDEAAIDGVAGAGHDRWDVAKKIGALLPRSTLLSGLEQDDSDQCDGVSYAMVRVEKARVDRFLKESSKFKSDLAESLLARVDRAEQDIAGLKEGYGLVNKRLAALETRLGKEAGRFAGTALASAPEEIKVQIRAIKKDISSGRPSQEIERELSLAETDLTLKILASLKKGREDFQPVKKKLLATRPAKDPKDAYAGSEVDTFASDVLEDLGWSRTAVSTALEFNRARMDAFEAGGSSVPADDVSRLKASFQDCSESVEAFIRLLDDGMAVAKKMPALFHAGRIPKYNASSRRFQELNDQILQASAAWKGKQAELERLSAESEDSLRARQESLGLKASRKSKSP